MAWWECTCFEMRLYCIATYDHVFLCGNGQFNHKTTKPKTCSTITWKSLKLPLSLLLIQITQFQWNILWFGTVSYETDFDQRSKVNHIILSCCDLQTLAVSYYYCNLPLPKKKKWVVVRSTLSTAILHSPICPTCLFIMDILF